MKPTQSRLLAAGLAWAVLTGFTGGRAADQDKSKEKKKTAPTRPVPPQPPRPPGPGQTKGREPIRPPVNPPTSTEVEKGKPPIEPTPTAVALTEHKSSNGTVVKVAPSGATRERIETKSGGVQHIQHLSPTGRVEAEVVKKSDGTRQTTQYDLGHREKTTEIVHPNGARQTTDVHYNRNGEVRARETITRDVHGAPVSKTVEVKNNLVIHNTTIVNNNVTIVNRTRVVREYRPCRYGFVYTPVVFAPAVYVGWYDPFWYAPPLVVGGPAIAIRTHSFTFAWGWSADPWYAYHRAYWEPYPVYLGPSYWVTDWMVASYLADRYAVAVSVEQTRQEAVLAREDAEKAKLAAQQAKDAAEIAEAKAAQAEAEARAERAELRVAKAEGEQARQKEFAASGKTNPNVTPIDKDTKEALNQQIEKTIAEKKMFAEQSTTGGHPVLPDVSQSLADPTHIYPVSKTISVISKDDKPAGTLTAGDLLKAEPGQDALLKDATGTTFVMMRVMTSKAEEDSVPAGTVIKVPVKELQDFDNDLRAKVDQGLELATANKDKFKQSAQ